MKFILVLLTLLLLGESAYSQQTATVYGQIIHPTDEQVFLSYYSNFINYEEVIIDSAVLNKKGFFHMQFPWDKPWDVTFHHGEEITEMHISPGDSIQLVLDTEQFDESIRYVGKGAVLNTYLAQKYLQAPAISQELYKMSESVFTHYTDSILDRQLAFCESYFSGTGSLTSSEQTFLTTERQNLLYDAVNQKLSYPMLHGYVTGKRGIYKPEADYYSFLNEVPLVAEHATGSLMYMEFLTAYVQHEFTKRVGKDTSIDQAVLRRQIIDEKWQGYLRDFLYTNWIYETLTYSDDMTGATALFAALRPAMQTPELVAFLEEAFSIRAILAAGNPAPLFSVKDENGKAIELSQFLGKTVYLDIWATWCGPCLKEIPALEQLITDMAGKEVVFLSVSVDTDEKAWSRMIHDRDMKGVHAISPGNFSSPIAKAFQVEGIPRYVIIDKEGKIFSANASRPGQVKTDLEKCIAQ